MYVNKYQEQVFKCFGANAVGNIGIIDWLLMFQYSFSTTVDLHRQPPTEKRKRA